MARQLSNSSTANISARQETGALPTNRAVARSPEFSSPLPDSLKNWKNDPKDVYAEERESISTRRRKAWQNTNDCANDSPNWQPQSPEDKDDYVGLALSGGGIRAA